MNAKRSKKWIWITLGILLFIGAVVFISLKAIGLITENKRANASPPTVQIVSPIAGDIFPVGQTIYTAATAVGIADIQYIELHLDGESAGKAFNDDGSSGAFDGQFEFTIADGGHMLSARTVDKNGLVGQSIPIPVYGTVETENTGALVFTSDEGDTLASIADDFGMDLDDLKQLNPDLGGGELPPSTIVNLPDDNIEEPPPEPAAAGGGQPGQPGTTTKKDVTPPNTPMLTEKIRANPIINPFKVLTQIKPPKAPDGLEVSHEGCLVTMKWNDNSESEDSYRIWFTGLGLPPRVIATVSSSEHTGPVWYQFTTPPAGIYGFWVEAVNIIGAQPSEEFWLGIPATQCESYTAAYLEVEVKRITFYGQTYNRMYCYISVEGSPEQRFPHTDDDSILGFFSRDVKTTLHLTNQRYLSVPIPNDGILELEGECLGWAGNSLSPLGTFTESIPSAAWDGSDQEIGNSNFKINISINPSGSLESPGSYTFSDPLIKAPYNLQIVDTGHRDKPDYPTNKMLIWEWEGIESEIEGFTVFLNGNPFMLAASPDTRAINYKPRGKCGKHMKFEVAANLPNGQSPRSVPEEYDQDPCPLWAEVQFVSIETRYTDDSFFGGGECDTLQAYFSLTAWGTTHVIRKLGYGHGKSYRYPMTCNKLYTFDDIGYAFSWERDLDRMIVQIDPNFAYLRVDILGWDYDIGPNDKLVIHHKQIPFLPVDNWQAYDEEFILIDEQDAAWTRTIVRVRAYSELDRQN